MNPLEQLHDIQVPEQVSAWPLAWGWWALMALVLIALISGIVIACSMWRFRKVKRQALRALSDVQDTTSASHAKINAILKQSAIHYFPNQDVASLYGESWAGFMLAQLPTNRRNVLEKDLLAFQAHLYSAQVDQPSHAKSIAESWLKHALPPKKRANQQNVNEVSDA